MVQTSSEKLKHTELAEKNRLALVPQREQLANTPQPHLPKKEKQQSYQSKAPECKMGESQGGRKLHLGKREREIRAGAWR